MSHAHHELPANCLNCDTPLQGPWCHHCGQKASAVDLSVHDVLHEAVHEFIHLDGKILQTLKLLVAKPGQLTREFIAGRRARYISPLRLYLTFSVLFFAVAAIVPGARQAFIQTSSSREAAERGTVLNVEEERKADEVGEAVMHNIPRATFVLMPVFALLTWAFFRKQQRLYVPHLYYSVHFHAFLYLLMTVSVLFGVAGVIGKSIGSGLIVLSFPYHYIALRRVFGGSYVKVFAKGTAIGLLYLASVTLALIAIVKLSVSSL
jgi:hypothetical protein